MNNCYNCKDNIMEFCHSDTYGTKLLEYAVKNGSITPHPPYVLMTETGFTEDCPEKDNNGLSFILPLYGITSTTKSYQYKANSFSIWSGYRSLCSAFLLCSINHFFKRTNVDIIIRLNNTLLNSMSFLRWS